MGYTFHILPPQLNNISHHTTSLTTFHIYHQITSHHMWCRIWCDVDFFAIPGVGGCALFILMWLWCGIRCDVIIMYIYHALINALSAHIIHINLNMIFYTHVEHSPTKNKNALQRHTLTVAETTTIRMEILREEEGFQFGFKRWQGWAVSKVLWEWISNVGSKARENAKATSLAFPACGCHQKERSVRDGVLTCSSSER